MIKKFLKKHFESLAYFYRYLRYRVFIIVAFSLLIGILDGLGLTMFLPLLQMVDDSSNSAPELGNFNFLLEIIENLGLSLNLFSILIFMSIFFLLKGIVQYFAGIYKVNVQQGFIKRLRFNSIIGLSNISYKYFVTTDVGRIQNTLTGEVNKVAMAYIHYFMAFQYGILVFVYMAFAFTIDAQFAILVSIGGAIANLLYKNLYKNTKAVSRTLTGENSIFQSLVIQKVGNYKYLKATGGLTKYSEKLKKSATNIEISNKKIGQLDALLTAGREPILISVVVGVIIIQTVYFASPLGPILISLIFFYRALGYLMQLQVIWNKYLAVSGSLENMTSFEKELKTHREKSGIQDISSSIEELELHNAEFSYNQTPVLCNISLKIFKKETVAFVGESGSGKTTLVNILSGLLPLSNGQYYINKIPVGKISLKSLHSKVGYITQDPVIFNDTIYNNVSSWAEKNTENLQRFWNAVNRSAIFNFINELPEKEETILGNNGVNLSGGQRQRMSIARELFKEIEILILDEATSALDSETEKAIQKNIEELKGKYTILIVAHRISTIKNADRIVIMKDGKISNINSFENLLAESPYFKKLVELQEI